MLRSCQLLTILTSASLWRAGVVQILLTSWAADPPHHLAFRTYLCEPSKPRNYGKTQHFTQFLPAKISHVSRLRCKTSLLSNIEPARPTGNFQYSRKLELLNFLRLYIARFYWRKHLRNQSLNVVKRPPHHLFKISHMDCTKDIKKTNPVSALFPHPFLRHVVFWHKVSWQALPFAHSWWFIPNRPTNVFEADMMSRVSHVHNLLLSFAIATQHH